MLPRATTAMRSVYQRTRGSARAWAGVPLKNDYDPLQLQYPVKKGFAQPAIEDNFALSEDAAHRTSEGLGIDRRAANGADDANADQQDLERLVANVRSVQREETAARLPRAAQLPSVLGLAPVKS